MKNLFIMHTQYNLILSLAVMSRFKNAENTLVLYSEFTLSKEMLNTLKNIFDNVIVVQDSFYAPLSGLEDVKYIRKCMKKVRDIKKSYFDNVYMSQERVFDKILFKRAKKNNRLVKCYNIEEDAYYSINEKYNEDNFVKKESWREKRRKLLYFLCLLGYPYNYKETGYCYGMSSVYHGANLLFPALARKELQNKKLIEIKKDEIIKGVLSLYSQQNINLPDSDKYTVFFFDLMNRYNNPEKVKEIVKKIVKESNLEGRKVLLKYHPRETDKFEDIEGAFEIPNIIPAEKVLVDIIDKDVTVIGNATTSCLVAAKFGFKVVSISKIEFPNNKRMHTVMQQMGIACVEKI